MTQILIEEASKLNNIENTNSFINENQINSQEFNHTIEKKIDNEINNKCNKLKTYLLNIGKRILDVGIPVTLFITKTGLKSIGVAFLPITTIASIFWSRKNIDHDCKIYLDIFIEAFQDLKFKVLGHYINAFMEVIDGLDNLGKKLENGKNEN